MLEELTRTLYLTQDSFVLLTYLLCFLGLGLYFFISSQSFLEYLVSFFSLNFTVVEGDFVGRYLVKLFSIFGLVGFAIFCVNYYQPEQFISSGAVHYSMILRYGAIILGIILVSYLIKLIVLPQVSYIFRLDKQSLASFRSVASELFSFLGILLLMVSFLGIYSPKHLQVIFLVLGAVLILYFIFRYFTVYYNFFSLGNGGWYRFFLYLCTLKVLPILVLVKFLLGININ